MGQPEVDGAELLAQLKEIAPKILPFSDTVWKSLNQFKEAGKRILFEGAQGTMLDIDHGTYPFVTSSNTVSGQAAAGSGMGPSGVGYVLGITKAYTTRVGEGPFPSELFDEHGTRLGERGHEFGVVTGRKRRCGWFDAALVRQSVKVNGITGIAPAQAIKYVRRIEELIEAPVALLSTSPERDDTILVHDPFSG